MTGLPLSLAIGPYDRARALLDGRVRPEGVELRPLALHPAETFLRMCNGVEFDVAEMSLGAYTIGVARGDDRFVAIPVFPSRAFRHRDIYVSRAGEPVGPERLRGARIGVHRLHMTATIWQRAILQEELGIAQSEVTWVQAGVHKPGAVPGRIRIRVPDGITIQTERGHSIDEMLRGGHLAAALLSHPPHSFTTGDQRVGRLFEDPERVETDYYLRTRTYPIMHVVVLRRTVYERDPWLASTLTKAFTQAKWLGRQDSANAGYSPHMAPFFDLHQERAEALFGGDLYPYGLEQNRHVLEAFLRHCVDQHLLERTPTLGDLFPAEVMVSGELDAVGGADARPGPDEPGPGERPGETWRWD